MELLKLLSGSEIVAQIINFLLVLFLLRIFAWKKILGLLDQRKEKIASEFQRIEETRADIAKMKAKYDALLGAIEETAQAKIKEGIASGEKSAQEIKKIAQMEAERIIETAKKDIKFEIAKSREELKNSIVELVIRITEQMIVEKLTDQDDRKLAEDFLNNLDKLESSS